jgi:hypothetical protein
MTEERKHGILFAATILAARKLNDVGITPWARATNTVEIRYRKTNYNRRPPTLPFHSARNIPSRFTRTRIPEITR